MYDIYVTQKDKYEAEFVTVRQEYKSDTTFHKNKTKTSIDHVRFPLSHKHVFF